MRSSATSLLLAVGLLGVPTGSRQANSARAAESFRASLDAQAAARASLPFDDARRTDWHYVPRERPGIPLGALGGAQKETLRALFDSALSPSGLAKVDGVVQLESVLGRDPDLYFVSLFGTPGAPDRPGAPDTDDPWGWRIEGHHLSLNVTAVGDRVAVTPFFFGSQPTNVRQGEHAGLRVLGEEEDLARALVSSFDARQRTGGLKEDEVPRDVILGPGSAARLLEPAGIPAAQLSDEQRALLHKLLARYPANFDDDVTGPALAHAREARDDDLRFLWIGGTEPGEAHYWRIQSKDFVIEWDDVQNGANHAHTLWRDLHDDFGEDLLRRHHEEHHGKR